MGHFYPWYFVIQCNLITTIYIASSVTLVLYNVNCQRNEEIYGQLDEHITNEEMLKTVGGERRIQYEKDKGNGLITR